LAFAVSSRWMSAVNARQIDLSVAEPGSRPRELSDNQQEISLWFRLCSTAKYFPVGSRPNSILKSFRNASSRMVRIAGTGPTHRCRCFGAPFAWRALGAELQHHLADVAQTRGHGLSHAAFFSRSR
jgi:hypothetical protein